MNFLTKQADDVLSTRGYVFGWLAEMRYSYLMG